MPPAVRASEASSELAASPAPLSDAARMKGQGDPRYIHASRRKEMAARHPDLQDISGTEHRTGFFMAALVALQLAGALGAVYFKLPIVAWFPISYLLGAVVSHALYVLIHDCVHNLAHSSADLNRALIILGNSVHVFPSGILFRHYHLIHHREMNDNVQDPDVPAHWEANLVQNSAPMKAFWMAFYSIFQSARTVTCDYKSPLTKPADAAWIALNYVVNFGLLGVLTYATKSYVPALYLLVASMASVGFHPLGARWIQEHYPTLPFQATYSYYGPLNWLMFNVGFHNEHHDFPTVPWSRLPQVKDKAPEYYNSLFAHYSYTKLLADFIVNPQWDLMLRRTKKVEDLADSKPEQVSTDAAKKVL